MEDSTKLPTGDNNVPNDNPKETVNKTQEFLDSLSSPGSEESEEIENSSDELQKASEAADKVAEAKRLEEEEAAAIIIAAKIKEAKKLAADKRALSIQVTKRLKGAVFTKVVPDEHFKPLTAEVKNELVSEAAKHLLWENKWDVNVVETAQGKTYIVELK